MGKIFECSYPDEKTFPLGYRPRESNPGTLTTYFRSTTPDLVPRIFAQQVDCEVCPVFLQIERGRAGSLPPPSRLRSAFRRAHRRSRRSRTARSAKDSTVYRTGDKRALGMRCLVWRCIVAQSGPTASSDYKQTPAGRRQTAIVCHGLVPTKEKNDQEF